MKLKMLVSTVARHVSGVPMRIKAGESADIIDADAKALLKPLKQSSDERGTGRAIAEEADPRDRLLDVKVGSARLPDRLPGKVKAKAEAPAAPKAKKAATQTTTEGKGPKESKLAKIGAADYGRTSRDED